MSLKPDALLERVPELDFKLLSDNSVLINLNRRRGKFGYHALPILMAFHPAATMKDVVERYQSSGTQDWMAFTRTIIELYQFGALQDADQPDRKLPDNESLGFANLTIHTVMLNDRERTSEYLACIHESVTPDDIVLDIGTGSGVLAVAAAQAGAKHVYAIEASGIAAIAQQVFEANGVADRITLMRGWSKEVSVPERATVLVSEIIGNDPLDEDVISVTLDARKRLLRPDARLIPSRLEIFALPVTIPTPLVNTYILSPDMLVRWQNDYRIDFKPLAEGVGPHNYRFARRPYVLRDWPCLADPVLLAEVDFHTIDHLSFDVTVQASATADGTLSGIVLYSKVYLGPDHVLSRHPLETKATSSWMNIVWGLQNAFEVRVGDSFEIAFKFLGTGFADMDAWPVQRTGPDLAAKKEALD